MTLAEQLLNAGFPKEKVTKIIRQLAGVDSDASAEAMSIFLSQEQRADLLIKNNEAIERWGKMPSLDVKKCPHCDAPYEQPVTKFNGGNPIKVSYPSCTCEEDKVLERWLAGRKK